MNVQEAINAALKLACLIPLTNSDKFVLVDKDDYFFLSKLSWSLTRGYATRRQHISSKGGVCIRKTVIMHRVINNTPKGMDTDHINGDKLDNRKENLRSCLHSENTKNKRAYNKIDKSSKYKGVSKTRQDRWLAGIGLNGKTIYLGRFDSENLAAQAYNEAALEYHGEFASLNKITC